MIAHAVVLSVLLAAAQSTTAVVPPKESAVISGVVVDRHTGTPVRSAVVSVNPPYGRGISRTVTTDAAGRFEFASLPAGEYVLSAARIGYLPTNFGEQRMGGPGVSIRVTDDEARDDVAIPMSRGGTISGRVLNEYGDTVPGVQVQAMRYQFENGTRVLRPVFLDRTDDRGEFRLFTLPGGQYLRLRPTCRGPADWINDPSGESAADRRPEHVHGSDRNVSPQQFHAGTSETCDGGGGS